MVQLKIEISNKIDIKIDLSIFVKDRYILMLPHQSPTKTA